MYAVFETGGKQYRAVKGETVRIEMMEHDPDQPIRWNGICVSAEGVTHVVVHAQPMGIFKEDKVIIFKKKRRTNYRRKTGHRQKLLWAKITDVVQVSASQ
jgi:large subunit ribosomal protein L21